MTYQYMLCYHPLSSSQRNNRCRWRVRYIRHNLQNMLLKQEIKQIFKTLWYNNYKCNTAKLQLILLFHYVKSKTFVTVVRQTRHFRGINCFINTSMIMYMVWYIENIKNWCNIMKTWWKCDASSFKRPTSSGCKWL